LVSGRGGGVLQRRPDSTVRLLAEDGV
jgi:hypothetical protein